MWLQYGVRLGEFMRGAIFILLFSTALQAEDICLPDLTAIPSEKYPATIQIQTKQGNCTAAIVGPNVIITAAHCGYEKNKENEDIIPEGKTGTFVAQNKKHTFTFIPSTRNGKDVRLGLAPDASLGLVHSVIENINPISVGFENPKAPLIVLGYGRGPLSEYIAKTDEEDELKRHMISNDSQNRYSCPGDSGGPTLARNSQKQLELVGVHSSTDLNRYTRDIRTNSQAFKKFIKQKTEEYNLQICGYNLDCN